jgi:hypothetical protein
VWWWADRGAATIVDDDATTDVASGLMTRDGNSVGVSRPGGP